MKFYSYTTKNNNNTKAISLRNVRAVRIIEGDGKSAVRYSVRVEYINNTAESFNWLFAEEAREVYNEIVTLLNKND